MIAGKRAAAPGPNPATPSLKAGAVWSAAAGRCLAGLVLCVVCWLCMLFVLPGGIEIAVPAATVVALVAVARLWRGGDFLRRAWAVGIAGGLLLLAAGIAWGISTMD